MPVEVLDQLDEIAGQLRQLDDRLGGGTSLRMIRTQLQYVGELLDQRRYPEVVGRRLHSTAAELMRRAGWSPFESGRHPQAQRYWVAALHAAHAAGDRALGAHIIGFMSEQANDLGQIRQAVALAEIARAGYPGAAPRVAAILDLHAAMAHGHDRARTESRRALDTAFDRLGDAPSSSGEPDWCYWLDEPDAHAQAGYCYLRLEDYSRARQHLSAALRLQDPSYCREGARRRIELAETYLRQNQPEVDHAVSLASHAADALSGEVDSMRRVGHLHLFAGHLAPFKRRPPVRQFLDQVTELRLST